ncbi:MAG: hypothetical protein ACRDH5_19810 [bacterium]
MTEFASELGKQASTSNAAPRGTISATAPRAVVKALLDEANFPYRTLRGRVWVTLAAFPGDDVVAFLRANGFR